MRLLPLLALILLVACPTVEAEPEPEPGDPLWFPITIGEGVDRPAEVRGPADVTTTDPGLPVIFVLHGFGTTGLVQEEVIFHFSDRIEQDRFLLVLPDGTKNGDGTRFWNATPACCGFGSDVDDVGYLLGLLDELAEVAPVDPERVYFTGHSNGGFMSYRMACERPDLIAAIMPLAGSTFLTGQECAVGDPVSVLHIHPELDDSVLYDGEAGWYPPAIDVVERWAGRAGCDVEAAVQGEPLDLLNNPDGAETRVLEFREGCQGGKVVDLWTVQETGHVPTFGGAFPDAVIPWLLSRSR